MNRFYSQSGEDFILNEIFQGRESGFFVEVGCIDGRRFSNTLHFEEKGWKGICVEAHAGYIEMLRKNRPNSIICHCAAGEIDEDTVFYANSRGSLSTLDKSQEKRWKKEFGKYFTGFEEQQVKKKRLDSIFTQCGIKQIDFMSLDIEGYEAEALKGIDFSTYKPTVILVESDSPEHKKALDGILRPAGYLEIGNLGGNIFYSLDKSLGSSIKGKFFKNVSLIHTQHPLDSGGDREITVDIDMRSNTSMAVEEPDLVTPFRMTAAQRLKSEYEKRRYLVTDFRHYKARWNGVNGWLTYEQAEWLFEAAKKMNPVGEIVEIGSAYGRSTVCLGSGVKISQNGKVYSVDPHIGGKGFREQLQDKNRYSSFDGFKENLKRFEIETEVVPVVKTSEDALKDWKGQKIRLLFIDGWHTYEAVTHDILGWERNVIPGGIIVLHDYQDEGVRRAIHDCMQKLGVSEKDLQFVNGEMVFFIKPSND